MDRGVNCSLFLRIMQSSIQILETLAVISLVQSDILIVFHRIVLWTAFADIYKKNLRYKLVLLAFENWPKTRANTTSFHFMILF